jgi:hypothetical protein
MDITRTIRQEESADWIACHFDGRRTWANFPLPGRPSDVVPGDHLYLIYRGIVVGRFEIERLLSANEITEVGTEDQTIDARCLVRVTCPGERAPRVIHATGHMGIRYTDPLW